MDFEALKRLGLAYMNIDCEKSYESYNETNNNHIINIYLKKDEKTCCPNCGSNNVISRGSIKRTLEFANTAENNITLIWYRKRFTCKNCNHFFQENNPSLYLLKNYFLKHNPILVYLFKEFKSFFIKSHESLYSLQTENVDSQIKEINPFKLFLYLLEKL